MEEGKKKTAYISYTRRADRSLLEKLSSAAQGELWEIRYDETALGVERSICAFTTELSEGERIIFLLSPEYFTSAYCVDELLLTYGKRAGNLLPIVVFTTGCDPKAIQVDAIVDYWQPRKPENAERLPLAISWLLGRYDSEKQNWDTLFDVVTERGDAAAASVIKLLEQKREVRFNYFSAVDKQTQIRKGVDKVVTGDHFESIRAAFDIFKQPSVKADELKVLLNALVKWLEVEVENEEVKDAPSSGRCRRLAKDVKKLVGLIALTAIDDVAIQHCIHRLNRERDSASLLLKANNECSFQIVVSAVANSPVYYIYHTSEGDDTEANNRPALMGEGELVLHERGICKNNYYDAFSQEASWMRPYKELSRQMAVSQEREPAEDADLDSVRDGIEGFLGERDDFFLLLDQEELDTHKDDAFRKELAGRFPTLQQVVSLSSDDHSAEHYFIDGLGSGFLNQKLIAIYSLIHRLSQ